MTLKNTRIPLIPLAAIILMALSMANCKTNETNTFQKEMELLNQYIADNNITVTPTASGLYHIILKEGSGDNPVDGNLVTVRYIGKFLDGQIFDSGTYNFQLGRGQVIKGWDEGIALMKKGEKAILIIPSTLAYGATGMDIIPPYTTLLFEVELLKIDV